MRAGTGARSDGPASSNVAESRLAHRSSESGRAETLPGLSSATVPRSPHDRYVLSSDSSPHSQVGASHDAHAPPLSHFSSRAFRGRRKTGRAGLSIDPTAL